VSLKLIGINLKILWLHFLMFKVRFDAYAPFILSVVTSVCFLGASYLSLQLYAGQTTLWDVLVYTGVTYILMTGANILARPWPRDRRWILIIHTIAVVLCWLHWLMLVAIWAMSES